MMRLGIIGGGRAAWAFGSAWRRAGWPVAGVWLRNESRSRIADLLGAPRRTLDELASDVDLLLVGVSDRAIADVAAMVPDTPAVIFHASGALLSLRGGFSLHPLKSLPPVGEPSDLAGTLLVFEGNHRETAEAIARKLGARFAEIAPSQKALYHAAAVFGANYVAAVLDIASRLMTRAGVSGAREDLAALALSAMENWRRNEDEKRFTGPAARGDEEVLRHHVDALRDDPQLAKIYELLAGEITASILATPK